MKEQDEKDYEDLLKAERKVKREKKQNSYRRTYNESWIVNGVADLCVCDK